MSRENSIPLLLNADTVREYIFNRSGIVYHTDIVNYFKPLLTDPENKELAREQFKRIVNQIANVTRDERGEKFLVLKKPTKFGTDYESSPIASPEPGLSSATSFSSLATCLPHASSIDSLCSVPSSSKQPPPYRSLPPVLSPKSVHGSNFDYPMSPCTSESSHEKTPPPVPPRRRSSDKIKFNNKENEPEENAKPVLTPEESENKVAENEQKISVKERTQRFNRLASVEDPIPKIQQPVGTSAAYKKRFDQLHVAMCNDADAKPYQSRKVVQKNVSGDVLLKNETVTASMEIRSQTRVNKVALYTDSQLIIPVNDTLENHTSCVVIPNPKVDINLNITKQIVFSYAKTDNDVANLLKNGTNEDFEYFFNVYQRVLEIKFQKENHPLKKNKNSNDMEEELKLKSEIIDKFENVSTLDNWFKNTLPAEFSSRKEKYFKPDEILNVLEWQLARSRCSKYKFLRTLIHKNGDDLENVSRVALEELPDRQKALKMFTSSGPKGMTIQLASALLTAADPERFCFWSQECFAAVDNFKEVSTPVENYDKFIHQIEETANRLNRENKNDERWNCKLVEEALWSFFYAKKLAPEILHKIPYDQSKTGDVDSSLQIDLRKSGLLTPLKLIEKTKDENNCNSNNTSTSSTTETIKIVQQNLARTPTKTDMGIERFCVADFCEKLFESEELPQSMKSSVLKFHRAYTELEKEKVHLEKKIIKMQPAYDLLEKIKVSNVYRKKIEDIERLYGKKDTLNFPVSDALFKSITKIFVSERNPSMKNNRKTITEGSNYKTTFNDMFTRVEKWRLMLTWIFFEELRSSGSSDISLNEESIYYELKETIIVTPMSDYEKEDARLTNSNELNPIFKMKIRVRQQFKPLQGSFLDNMEEIKTLAKAFHDGFQHCSAKIKSVQNVTLNDDAFIEAVQDILPTQCDNRHLIETCLITLVERPLEKND